MNKHTPGPWIYAPGVMGGSYCIWAKPEVVIAKVDLEGARYPYAETVANAHLIAAAPEMLDALLYAEHMFAESMNAKSLGELVRFRNLAASRIAQAIAKAENKQ